MADMYKAESWKREPAPAGLDRLFDKLPPHEPEAEAALIGSMIQDHTCIGDIADIIESPSEFSIASHGTLYEALLQMWNANEPVDAVTLKTKLARLGVLEAVGGVPGLINLGESVPHAKTAPYYAKIVHESHIIRALIDAAGAILHDAYTRDADLDELLDDAESKIFALRQNRTGTEPANVAHMLNDLYNQLQDRDGRAPAGLDTGFTELNDLTGGLQDGDMVIIAGRPSMGKTALALAMATHIGLHVKVPVGIFSLEMSRAGLSQRMLSANSGVDSRRMARNVLNADEFSRLASTVGRLSDSQIFVDDLSSMTAVSFRARARRMAAKHGVKVIFLDYLQLMTGPKSDSRQAEVAAISRTVKSVAQELQIPVIALSQLNRAAESREDRKPRMSELRESGALEQDADLVMLIHREEYYHPDREWREEHPDKCGVAELILAKQRNGPTGLVSLQFDEQTTRFSNLAPQHLGDNTY